MKFSAVLSVWAIISPALIAEEEAQPQVKPIVVKERPGHAQLEKTQKKQDKLNHEKRDGKGIEPIVTVKKKKGIVERSTILASGSRWAIVPKGSVIHVPNHLKGRVVSKPKGTLQGWSSFLRKNGGWIHTHEITLKQASGQEYLGEEKVKAYKTLGQIVIATYGGNPTSVSPKALTPPEKEVVNK